MIDRVLVGAVGSRELVRGEVFELKNRTWAALAADVEDCSFEGARCKNFGAGSGAEPTIYRRCSFRDAWLTFSPGGVARFEKCDFTGARLKDWSLMSGELIDCTFTGRLHRCLFSRPREPDSAARFHFFGNDFSQAEMIDCDFRYGIDLSRQKLPQGPGCFYAENGAQAIEQARERARADRDDDAMMILDIIDKNLVGQQQLFDSAATWPDLGLERWRRMWGLD